MQNAADCESKGELRLRAKKTIRITVSVSETEHAQLLALAERYDVSVSRLARQAFAEFLERYGKGAASLLFTQNPTQRTSR